MRVNYAAAVYGVSTIKKTLIIISPNFDAADEVTLDIAIYQFRENKRATHISKMRLKQFYTILYS